MNAFYILKNCGWMEDELSRQGRKEGRKEERNDRKERSEDRKNYRGR